VAGGCAPGISRGRWGTERGWSNFMRHEMYINSVSSVEAGMGMEGEIMCIEKCTF